MVQPASGGCGAGERSAGRGAVCGDGPAAAEFVVPFPDSKTSNHGRNLSGLVSHYSGEILVARAGGSLSPLIVVQGFLFSRLSYC